MKAVASRVTEKSDVLLLTAVDMDESGPYEIAEPRVITALETYTPSCKLEVTTMMTEQSADQGTGLQTPKLKRLAEIVSAQALQQQERQDGLHTNGNGYPDGTQGLAIENVDGTGM